MNTNDKNKRDELVEADRNPDAITGEPGSHPFGSGLGAAAGGTVAGAAAGAVGGPVGAALGAVVGGVAGGLAGKAVAEQIDPTVEAAYWQENYSTRDYINADTSYDLYEPAYRYGYESRARAEASDFAAAEADLKREWEANRGESTLDWDLARPATEDAWNRVDQQWAETNKPK